MKKVLDVGNCGPDNFALTEFLAKHFQATVVRAHGMQDAMEQLKNDSFDLVTVNRLMDRDGSCGLEIIKAIKADETLSATAVMMVTNFPEHQERGDCGGCGTWLWKSQLGHVGNEKPDQQVFDVRRGVASIGGIGRGL